MFGKQTAWILAILFLGTAFELAGFFILGTRGTSYARWIFYSALALGLIHRFELGLGFAKISWNRATLLLSFLIVVSPLLYGFVMNRFDWPRLPTDRSLMDFCIFSIWCPVFEELTFRQALQQFLKKNGARFGTVMVLVNLLFAFYHPGFLLTAETLGLISPLQQVPEATRQFLLFQVPDTFIAGALFSILREKSGSTVLCMALHAYFNTVFFLMF